jgi:hypothetical protein
MSLGPPDLSGVVQNFSFPVVRRRSSTPVTSRGLSRSGGYTDATIAAHVYDASADVLERAFPGQENVRAIELHTVSDVRTVGTEQSPLVRGDVIVFRAKEFEVVEVAEWNTGAAGARSYLRALAREVTR